MIYLVAAVLIGASLGVGVAVKSKVPTLGIIMAVLISFLALLLLVITVAEALGKLGPRP